ncbi:MAG: hypothetical protein M3140_06175, partial [Actinomycetota bacterium]|nr:hypothetical protein [Actinomycetota bacterium]
AAGLTAPAQLRATAAAPATWYAGAAAQRITPPAYSAADDARDFPLCNTTVFSGARHFDFEEPYVDVAGTGFFDPNQDPYCDANANHRWDGPYNSGGVARIFTWVLSDIWARALAISDGSHTVVIESLTSQGLGGEDVARIRSAVNGYRGASGTAPPVVQVFVSSNHNESSPDPIGIYGAPADPTGTFGLNSGIDDYYISYLVNQAAVAARSAVDALVPAHMRIGEFQPPDVAARLSNSFLTTDSNGAVTSGPTANGTAESTNTKALVLQLLDGGGSNIETLFNWAAHNQQTGHAAGDAVAADPHDGNTRKPINAAVSDDWPGVFSTAVENALGGHAMFLVGDNGTIEDPHATPTPNPDNECPGTDFNPPHAQPSAEGCATLPILTGTRLANDVLSLVGGGGSLGTMETVAPHALAWATSQFYVPLQNQLFVAAFGAGIFAHHTAATASACQDSTGATRTCFRTEVGLVDLGPQLEMLVNPGEAYPALIQGHPFGQEQISCPERAEPPTPAWHAGADHKIEVGLGDDMIGYEIPAPGWFSDPGVYADPLCPLGSQAQSNPSADIDQHNNYHKLESESVGPDAGNLVDSGLAALADCAGAGTLASCTATAAVCQGGPRTIEPGRFLLADGSFTRKGRDGPVGLWVLPCGSTAFTPGSGTLISISGIGSFGTTPVAATGVFMDFDGRPQSGPDINTRGMSATGPGGTITRYFVDPYLPLTGSSPGPAGPTVAMAESPGTAALLLLLPVAVGLAGRRTQRRRR